MRVHGLDKVNAYVYRRIATPPRTYICDCGTEHKISGYAVAQTAMGHGVTHHCVCGRRNLYRRDGRVVIGKLPRQVIEAEKLWLRHERASSWFRLLLAAYNGDLPVGARR